MSILVVYASADASTAEIGRRIAQRLRERGHDASDQPVGSTGSLNGVDAIVLGSAIHGRQWLDEATSFVNTNRQAFTTDRFGPSVWECPTPCQKPSERWPAPKRTPSSTNWATCGRAVIDCSPAL